MKKSVFFRLCFQVFFRQEITSTEKFQVQDHLNFMWFLEISLSDAVLDSNPTDYLPHKKSALNQPQFRTVLVRPPNCVNLDWFTLEVDTLKKRYNTRKKCNGVQWGAITAINAIKPLTPLPSYISFWAKGLRLLPWFWNRGRATSC